MQQGLGEKPMKAVWFVVCLAISASASAQERAAQRAAGKEWQSNSGFTNATLGRAQRIAPKRRDAPLRELNLTDNEVREVQAATKSWLPHTYLNISPVVTGCPCEDGPGCKEQVYILADAGEKSVGILLSRIRDEWTVGDVQKWWVRYARLLEERDKMDWFDYKQAEFKMAREFPVCTGPENATEAPKTAQAGGSSK
jgi:hypothetical protein